MCASISNPCGVVVKGKVWKPMWAGSFLSCVTSTFELVPDLKKRISEEKHSCCSGHGKVLEA